MRHKAVAILALQCRSAKRNWLHVTTETHVSCATVQGQWGPKIPKLLQPLPIKSLEHGLPCLVSLDNDILSEKGRTI